MLNKKTGIIIVDYNNARDTINCLESVLRQSDHDLIQIVIVDNGSSNKNIFLMTDFLNNLDISVEYFDHNDYLEGRPSFINYIKSKDNLGYAQGNNIGLNFFSKSEEIEYILILNNDILFTMPLIEPLKETIDSNPSYGIVSPILLKSNGDFDYNCARKEPSFNDIIIEQSILLNRIPFFASKLNNRYIIKGEIPIEPLKKIEMPSGSCFLIRKKLFLSVGGFDPSTFLYYEENILYRKLLKTGFKSILLTTTSCIHLGGNSTKRETSLFLVRCSQFSLLHYMKKYRSCPKVLLIYFKTVFAIRNLCISIKIRFTQ